MSERTPIRLACFSRLVDRRSIAVSALLLGLCLALGWVSLMVGKHTIAATDVFHTLMGHGTRPHTFIIEQLRMPRLLMACLVGAALSVSGLILQSIVRNPLASPDIMGITGGASAAAVGFLSFLAPVMSQRWLPLFAIGGALSTAIVVYVLAFRRGTTPMRLVLTGIGISTLMAAITTLFLVISPLSSTLTAYVWLTGSVFGATWPDVRSMIYCLLLTLPGLIIVSRKVGILELDDALATGLGVHVQGTRLILLALSVALAGSAVAHVGAIAFVGLIAPHIARAFVPHTFAGLATVSALTGALLVAGADLAGRTLFLPLDLPAGMFVSGLGALFFVYLLMRQLRK